MNFVLLAPSPPLPSEVVIYQPPQLQTKLADTEVTYKGEATANDLSTFVKENL